MDEILKKLEDIAIEMQKIFYKNERWFDRFSDTDTFGFDNVVGNFGCYELAYYCHNDKKKAAKEIARYESFYDDVAKLCDRHGYGARAAMCGFDVTKPFGRYWTLSQFGKMYIEKLKELLK